MNFEGLSSKRARELLIKYGENNYNFKILRSAWKIFFSQLTSPLIYLLIVASIIAYFIGDKIESLTIIFIVVVNALLGFFQEYKAERLKRELMNFAPQMARVYRDGKLINIKVNKLVPGDIIKLNIGDLVPADSELIQSDSLSVNESQLTGESRPVLKGTKNIKNSIYPPNMIYAGSSISSGEGVAVVINTGLNTEFGKLGIKALSSGGITDFETGINKFNNYLLKFVGVLSLFILIINFLKNGFLDSLLFTLAVIVGILPESLPIVITISLSQVALLMAKNKVVVKRLSAVEDLGNMDTLCCDKTGTLTEGKLKLIKYVNLNNKKDNEILIQGYLCNNANNPIDKAILSHKLPNENSLKKYKVIDRNEFDFERKRMSVLVENKNNNYLFVKGEPNSILSVCSYCIFNGKKIKLSKLIFQVKEKIKYYEENGYKVILTAFKKIRVKSSSSINENNLILNGFLIFFDSPKKSVKKTLSKLRDLGIKIKIISGDSDLITRRVCLDSGLSIVGDKIITGEELESLSDNKFDEYCEKYNVFARIKPLLKHRIIQSLNKEGRTIGFLGDGINDAPSLKAADIGISVNSAVGIARESADILLLKKSLSVIINGVLFGRKVFLNIVKYIKNTMSANLGNVITVTLASIFLRFIPMLPSQVLLNNLITDTPLMAISTDNVDKNLLNKPRKLNLKSIRNFMVSFGFLSSFVDFLIILPLFFIGVDINLFRTAWFIESSLSEIIITFIIRTKKLFFKDRPSNSLLVISLLCMSFIIGIVYVKFGYNAFSFVPLNFSILMLIFVVLGVYILLAELLKKRFINAIP